MELAQLVKDNAELFAKTNTEENGKMLCQSTDEAGWLSEYIIYFAQMARHMVTVDNAYGRTAQLQAYDYDTKEYVTKSTYQLDNAQTSTVQLTYDNSWKPYYYCAWIFCL